MAPTRSTRHNVAHETEQALLAILWAGWAQAEQLLDLPKHFFADDGHQRIYDLLADCYKTGTPIDPKVIASQLAEDGGDVDYAAMDETRNADANPALIPEYLHTIVHRNKLALSLSFGQKAHGANNDELTKLSHALVAQMDQMDTLAVPKKRSFLVADVSHAFFGQRPPTIPTGIENVDRLFGDGLRPKELTIIAGEAGTGKSCAMATFAHQEAMREGGGHVLYVSKEMDARSIMFRIYASISGISVSTFEAMEKKAFKGTALTTEEQREYELFMEAHNALDGIPYRLHFLDLENHPTITPAMIAQEVRAINHAAAQQAQPGVSLVIVDYLQILDLERERNQSDASALEEASKVMKSLSMGEGCHVLMASSMNRDTSASGMNRLRNSGGIQFNADNVIMMTSHRELSLPEVLAKEIGKAAILQLFAEKMRNGQPGAIALLKFQSRIQRISSIDIEDSRTILAAINRGKEEGKKTHAST